MSEVSEQDAWRIIRALTIQHPRIAQKIGISKASGQILRHLKANGSKDTLDLSNELSMSELHVYRVLTNLQENKYVEIDDNNKYRIGEA